MTAQYSRNAMSANSYPFNIITLAQTTITTTGRPASMPPGNSISGGVSAARSRPPTPTSTPRWRATTTSWCSCKPRWPPTTSKCGPTRSVWNLPERIVELQKETLRIATLRERQGLVTELDVQQATANLGSNGVADSNPANRLPHGTEPPLHLDGRTAAPTGPEGQVSRLDSGPAARGHRGNSGRVAAAAARRATSRAGSRGAIRADWNCRSGLLSPHRHHRHDRPSGRAPEPVVRIRAAWSARSVPA